uniref:Dehydrogenase/reductase SDR family member 4-like n=2 Tax=Hirondellea gigas TaxID=1518452 RepID=A0A2P2HWQ2_9CRUS
MLRNIISKASPFTTFASRSMSQAAEKKLSGKVAIITASTEGIGFAIARRLAQDGAKVVVSSRRGGNVTRAVKELEDEGFTDILGLQCNVAKEKDRVNLIEQTVAKFGGIDILVSNAAVNPAMGGVLDCPEPVWDKIFDVNVKSAMLISQLVLPHMRARKGGAIVYVASIGGYHPIDNLGAYSVSKTTLLGLCKAVAQQLAPDNIRANAIAPGIVKTRFSLPLHGNEEVYKKMLATIPMGRMAEPREMAGLVSFLVSDDASYITGENFIAAGGMPSRL